MSIISRRPRLLFGLLYRAVLGVEEMEKITGRKRKEVIADALNTYEWILIEQAHGRIIISTTRGSAEDETELDNFVVDKEAALKYFAAD